MGARTGKEFLKGLRTNTRELWLGNERVDDPTEHPALAGGARSLARVFDVQHEFPDDCLMPDPETGESINVSHMIPRSKEDIKRRHVGLTRISEETVGLMGRTPDYMNVTYAGFAGDIDRWAGPDRSNAEGAENLKNYQKFVARQDISLTHTIVHPSTDKTKGEIYQGAEIPLHKVGETEHGIIVRGARILSTLAPFADELAVYPAMPLPPIEDAAKYALAFCIPMNTPGLIFLCRDSVSTPESNQFDRPLSSRFDEQDAFIIYDNVEVPWERLHINGNVEVYSTVMMFSPWWPNIMQQTTIRALTKLEFAYGLASKMARMVNDTSPHTIDLLGELWGYVEITRNAVLLAEEHAHDYGSGAWFPDGRALHPMRAQLATWMPRAKEILLIIGSHNLLANPSRAMLDDARLRPMIDEFMLGANGVSAEERAAVFRLAWDFCGSALAGRNDLYERNYLASSKTNHGMTEMLYADRTRAFRLVDKMLGR